MMARMEAAARHLARGLAAIGLAVLLAFAATTIADGVLRFFLASPIDAVRDLGGLVAAFAVACCIPLAIIERSSITIRFVTGFISPRAGRVADAAAAVLVELVLALMAWRFVLFARQAAIDGNATWMLRIPTAPVWAAVAGLIAVAALMQLLVLRACVLGAAPAAARHGA
jgi:TRAP-type C4-dicarboxylate transport system permease small subunit